MVGLPPSSSEAVAEQLSSEVDVTPEEGEMLTESTVGSVLSTLTLSFEVTVAPALSLAVAVQVTVSPGWTVLGLKVMELPPPRLLPPLLQA